MDKNKIKKVLVKAEKYAGLWANPDFQEWRKGVINKRLRNLNKKILSADVSSEEGKREAIENILRYQVLKYETDVYFTQWRSVEEIARKKLKEQ